MALKDNHIRSKIVLVAGAGQNVGKTTLICRLISLLSDRGSVVAVKVSSHFHELTEKQKVIEKRPGFILSEETDTNSGKDTSRYLQAGAFRSFYVQATDNNLPVLAAWLNRNINELIICESGALGNVITPGFAIFVGSPAKGKTPNWNFPYIETVMLNDDFNPTVKEIVKKLENQLNV